MKYILAIAFTMVSISNMPSDDQPMSIDKAYEILKIEIPTKAPQTEAEKKAALAAIKSAYRTLVAKYHPDKNVGKNLDEIKLAKNKFGEIQEAYKFLTEPEAIKSELSRWVMAHYNEVVDFIKEYFIKQKKSVVHSADLYNVIIENFDFLAQTDDPASVSAEIQKIVDTINNKTATAKQEPEKVELPLVPKQPHPDALNMLNAALELAASLNNNQLLQIDEID